jgi:amidophosphoribosyltransferase
MCGLVGFAGRHEIVYDLILGLTALQHRGQDAAGIVTFKEHFRTRKALGLVSDVFQERHLPRLAGNMGIGHVRYTTQGTNDVQNAQPFSANYPFGLAMVHNGNVTNFAELKHKLYEQYRILPETSNDLELILYTLAAELTQKDLKNLNTNHIFEAVKATQQQVKGAYAVICIIANYGLLAFMDPHGIRPLLLGKKTDHNGDVTYGFASETTCFDYLEYETLYDLGPGEAVFIDRNLQVHKQNCHVKPRAFCVFENIYFAREDSIMHRRLVAAERVQMGRLLAKKVREAGLQPDIVIDVPSSGYFAASGLAEALNIPYRRGFVKNNHVGRSFISPTQKERDDIVKKKLNPIKAVVAGKKVAVVDDSIVRGTTSKRIVRLLKNAGAQAVYFISAAPPITNPCIYGIDMAISTELIAAQFTQEAIADYIGADALIYQDLNDLKQLYADLPICTACFSGQYPVEGSRELLESVEAERRMQQ